MTLGATSRADGETAQIPRPAGDASSSVTGTSFLARTSARAAHSDTLAIQRLDRARGEAALDALLQPPLRAPRAVAHERPVRRAGGGETGVLGELGEAHGHAPLLQIRGRRVERAGAVRELPRDEAAVLQRRDADREIEPGPDDVDDVVGHQEIDAELRMRAEERRQHRRHHLSSERRRRREPQEASGLVSRRPHGGAAVVLLLEQGLGVREEGLALRRERHRPGGPMEETDAELGLERSEPPRGEHGRDLEASCRRREAPAPHGLDQQPDIDEVHSNAPR